jgi:hypothetical protein
MKREDMRKSGGDECRPILTALKAEAQRSEKRTARAV